MPGYGYPILTILTLFVLAGGALTLWLPLLEVSPHMKRWIKAGVIAMAVFYSSFILYRAATRPPVPIRSIR